MSPVLSVYMKFRERMVKDGKRGELPEAVHPPEGWYALGWIDKIADLTACPLCSKDSGDGFPHPECCDRESAYAWYGRGEGLLA